MDRFGGVARLIAVGGIALLASAAIAAQAPQTPLERYYSQPLKNLQVIAGDTPRPEVIKLMDTFVQGLGVSCTHCHVGPVNSNCPPTPDGVATCDFASDSIAAKQIARQMLLMVREINVKVPVAMGAAAGHATRVQCITCHRGVPMPEQLNEILMRTATSSGTPAAVGQFRDMRRRYYGGQSYDFSENGLLVLARELSLEKEFDEALSWLQLNLEYYPKSTRTYLAIAQAYQRKDDTNAAIATLQKALEIEPDNPAAKRQLDELKTASVR